MVLGLLKKLLVSITFSQKDSWTKAASIYEIYPRSFKDSNNDGIGDIKGIIEKLDYLSSLGIDAIWLGPVYKSPMRDFGYDVSDHSDIDPIFGTLDDFDNLVEKFHQRGMKIIMDFIPNHTSNEHPWFTESRSSKDNPKRDWYIWKASRADGSPPNNWISRFQGSAWEFDRETNEYYLHGFLKEQPDLNWRNPDVKKAMLRVLKFWLDRGVDGFRVDAFDHLYKDPKFRDDPPNPSYNKQKDSPYDSLIHIYSQNQPEAVEVVKEFCQILGSFEDKFIVSEAYVGVDEMKKLYSKGSGNYTPFNLNLINMPWDACLYKEFIDKFEEALEEQDLPNYVLGNHDRSRVASRIGQMPARVAAMLLFTLRGMPFIYYGEELGMENIKLKKNHNLDPGVEILPGLENGRDPVRSPMQWDDGGFSGFSKTKPWLPIHPNYKTVNVKVEQEDPASFLNLYKKLINFRKSSKVLLKGIYVPLTSPTKDIFTFIRELEGERVLILLNFSKNNQKIVLPDKSLATVVCNSFMDKDEGLSIDLNNLNLRPFEAYILKLPSS